MSLFRTSRYFRLLFTRFFHYWDIWHLISSFVLTTVVDFSYMMNIFSWGLHDRSVGCFTCHALKTLWLKLSSWCAFNLSFSSFLSLSIMLSNKADITGNKENAFKITGGWQRCNANLFGATNLSNFKLQKFNKELFVLLFKMLDYNCSIGGRFQAMSTIKRQTLLL